MLHVQRNKNTIFEAKKFKSYAMNFAVQRKIWVLCRGMTLFSLMSPQDLYLAFLVAFVAGWIKGMVGFAMPMVLISGLSIMLPPDLALAGLILPTLVTSGVQALREGPVAALSSIRRFRVFLSIGLLCLLVSAQLVSVMSPQALLLMIGLPVSFFALIQLLGVKLVLQNPSLRI